MSCVNNTILVLSLLCVAGCNTLAGVGRDVSYAGNSVVKWSTDMRDEIPSTGYAGEDTNKLVVTGGEAGAATMSTTTPMQNSFSTSYQPNTVTGAADDATYRARASTTTSTGLHTPAYKQY